MPASCLIDFPDPHADAATALRLRLAFGRPHRVLQARQLPEVRRVLDAVQDAVRQGQWCVGWLAYEAAPAFDPALAVHGPGRDAARALPLAWFAVHDGPRPWPAGHPAADARIEWLDDWSRPAFDLALARIRQAIAAGTCYQVNYTAPLHGRLHGDPLALFAALRRAQGAGYTASLQAGRSRVLSVSPELFFDWTADGNGRGSLLTRPMKGTAPRGSSAQDDAAQAAALRGSAKERAENVMIVDLLRNDVSRVAEPRSVEVPRLLHVQALPTAWQMTSDVLGRTRAGTTLADVFAALFPCGSVTGAPKVSAMRLIRDLESGARGVYCGALGVVRPHGDGGLAATFNVPIRTLQLQGRQLRCDVGSGIVWDADPDAEWAEWQVKRRFVERASLPFQLLETLALEAGRWRHLPEHLARMQASAAHFAYPWDAARVRACLDAVAAGHAQGLWRVRLRVDAQGEPTVQVFALPSTPTPVLLQLASGPVAQAGSEFVRHKTTRRQHYAGFAPPPGVFDTVLYNAAGQLTETTLGNLALQLDGTWVTPAQHCGLLPGVGRAVALRSGRLHEAVIHLDDLPRVQAWAFVNSLRGWLPARFIDATSAPA